MLCEIPKFWSNIDRLANVQTVRSLYLFLSFRDRASNPDKTFTKVKSKNSSVHSCSSRVGTCKRPSTRLVCLVGFAKIRQNKSCGCTFLAQKRRSHRSLGYPFCSLDLVWPVKTKSAEAADCRASMPIVWRKYINSQI